MPAVFCAADFTGGPGGPADAVAAAVRRCAELGGVRVVVPPGVWSSGPIGLASDVELHLEEGAVVEFVADWRSYLPGTSVRWEGMECVSLRPLIHARGASNVAVTGRGVLRGNGAYWHERFGNKEERIARSSNLRAMRTIPPLERVLVAEDDLLRPSFVCFAGCRDVLLEDFTIESGPMWTLHPTYCQGVTMRRVSVETSGPNTDGLDVDSCEDVLVEDCEFDTGDDCIAVKSGLDDDGARVGRPCRNVVVRRCRMLGGHAGVAIGSEVSGGISDIQVMDCEMSGTGIGVRLKSRPGRGGYVRNVRFENLRMRDIASCAVHVDLDYVQSANYPDGGAGGTAVEDVSFSDISCRDAKTGVYLRGNPGMPVKGMSFSRMDIEADGKLAVEGFPVPYSDDGTL